MEPTVAEQTGAVDREKLLNIAGRSRKVQMELAQKYGILDYPNPAGGCLLTDQQFGVRVKDLFDHQEEIDLEDMEMLRLGRHFRMDDRTKLIVGRNEQENMTLEEYLAPGRVLFSPDDFPAPVVLLLGPPSEQANRLALALITHYSRPEKRPTGAKVVLKIGVARGEDAPAAPTDSVALESGMDPAELERMRIA